MQTSRTHNYKPLIVRMARLTPLFLAALLATGALITGCESIFGTKEDSTTQEIFEEGRVDPQNVEDVVGYSSVLPFWNNFDSPTDIYIGYDKLAYVTDAEGLHVLDRADRGERVTIPMRGAVAVTQDRMLYTYVAARDSIVIPELDPDIKWDLPVVYKIKNANGAGEMEFVDTLIHPFADASRSTFASQTSRLNPDNRNAPGSDENVEFTGLTVLADNSLYVTRRGPRNQTGAIAAPDNIVLEFRRETVDGEPGVEMTNTRQIRNLSPTTPSLISGIGMSDIQSFVGPPQRESMTDDRSFIVAQASQDKEIPFRVLQITVRVTPDGLLYEPTTSLLGKDTTEANGFLYDQFKFNQPTGLAYAADGTNYIFAVDAGSDSLFQFQQNGYEGVAPPPASNAEKPIVVSFGGEGSGPKQFRNPSGVAYYDEVVYVADKGNNRISRYKLSTDFE